VVALDISGESLALTKSRAFDEGLGDKVWCVQASGEAVPFQKAFDRVAGVAILHHMDFWGAIDEIGGALKADGRAVFMEPLFHNPIIRLYRFCTPRKRTKGERPLTTSQISLLGSRFNEVRVRYYGLLSLLALPLLKIKLCGLYEKISGGLVRIDNAIASAMPFLRKYYWGCIFEVYSYKDRK
jgi:SAM-dependent methyltransferase